MRRGPPLPPGVQGEFVPQSPRLKNRKSSRGLKPHAELDASGVFPHIGIQAAHRDFIANPETAPGSSEPGPATADANCATWAGPLGAMTPNSARWPCEVLFVCVRRRTSKSRVRNGMEPGRYRHAALARERTRKSAVPEGTKPLKRYECSKGASIPSLTILVYGRNGFRLRVVNWKMLRNSTGYNLRIPSEAIFSNGHRFDYS